MCPNRTRKCKKEGNVMDKFKMTRRDNIFLAKRNVIDCIYSSSRLEGIAITFPETQEIFEGRNVAHLSIEDVVKVNDLKHAWQFILDTVDYPLDLMYVRQLNKEIGAGLIPDCGNLRIVDVGITGTEWKPEIPDTDHTKQEIENIMSIPETTERAITLMLYLMRAQLFLDGNKRVAQLAANQVMIQGGAGVISIPVSKQKDFFQLLIEYYESNDMRQIKEFVYNTSIEGYNSKDQAKAIKKEEEIDYQAFFKKKVPHSNKQEEEEQDEEIER